jgi:type II secretory pathway pseudopilin PulG
LLLELAIAMSIIGVISGFFIKKTIAANRALRIQITKNNMETVVMALASYVSKHSRLPRPAADKTGYENNASVDAELASFVGYIPFNTLGISAKTASDGEARLLIYIVESSLTSSFDTIYEGSLFSSSYFCYPITNPKIFINELKDSPDIVAFVIDTADNFPKISNKIIIAMAPYTLWMSRDMILMKYLKDAPCRAKKTSNSENDNSY